MEGVPLERAGVDVGSVRDEPLRQIEAHLVAGLVECCVARLVAYVRVGRARFFFNISELADGERRGPVSVSRYRRTRLAENFPVLPSDSI